MIVSYAGVELQVEHIYSFEQNAIYDPSGVDFLYTHVRLAVRAVWHAQATNSILGTAAYSIDALRHTLMQPRQALIVSIPSSGTSGSTVILRAPLRRPNGSLYPCDANYGPKPIGQPIIQFIGEKSAIVDFVVECWVNECATVRPILSHRWEMTKSVNQDYFQTRTINGTVVFRADWIEQKAAESVGSRIHLDQFRNWVFHPQPNMHHRTFDVSPTADNTVYRYTIVDKQIASRVNGNDYKDITRFDGQLTIGQGPGSISAAVSAGIQGATAAASATAILGPEVSVPSAVVGGVVGFIGGIALPTISVSLWFRLWGRPGCTDGSLNDAMTKVLARYRFIPEGAITVEGVVTATLALLQNTMSITYGLGQDERYIAVQASAEAALPAAGVQWAVGSGPFSYLGTMRIGDAGTDPYTTLSPVATREYGMTSVPSYAGVQGLVRDCIAQVIHAACANPNQPTNPTTPPYGIDYGP